MILEAIIEQSMATVLAGLEALENSQVVGSRLNQRTEVSSALTVVAVASGFRSNDAFSLSTITVPVTISIVTRVEGDSTGAAHNAVVEAIADKLSYWHKHGNEMESVLSSDKFLAGELRMDGGSTQTYDKDNGLWVDTLNISIRGAEKFTV